MYDCVIPLGAMHLNFHSPNSMYLITCCRCSPQYVGEAVQNLSVHGTGFKHPSRHVKILCDHFTKALYKGAK